MAKLVLTLFTMILAAQIIILAECFAKRESVSVSRIICTKAEKEALLSLKQDLVDPSGNLASWLAEEDECCRWDRVVCDNVTGHVTELNLGSASLTGKINPSLLDLKHLSHLNLHENDFGGIRIPSFLGSLVSLTYLNLANAGFKGMIPTRLGNLSNLQHLEIATNGFDEFLYSKNLDWISGLSSLEYLDLSYLNLSGTSDHLLLAINALPSLSKLVLSGCKLPRSLGIPSRVNLTSIEELDLSGNALEIPRLCGFLTNMTRLHSLDLSFNGFSSNIPSCLYTLRGLQRLELRFSNLRGVISQDVANLTSIVWLNLARNFLEGKLPSTLGNLCNLEVLSLGSNRFSGEISEALESLSGCLSNRIKSLYMSNCSFTGEITDRIGQFKNLAVLDLADNNISGPIPLSLGSLSTLETLDISSNLIKGVVSEAHFSNLTNLKNLDASANPLTLRVSPDWKPPFRLLWLDMSSTKLGHQFPLWLKSQRDICHLELSDTGISGVIPSWFWNLSSRIDWLGLSRNELRGGIPDLHVFGQLEFLDISSNELIGPLPRLPSSLEWLDLSYNSFSGDIFNLACNRMGKDNSLYILKLRGNLLEGNIPDCWSHWPSLRVVDLGSNNLSGEIPTSMGMLQDLRSLHLRDNSLTGEIPNSLRNCSSLNGLDLGLNNFVGAVPGWMGSLSVLSVLILRSNKLKGRIPVEICELVELQILDVADNNLSGTIPNCLKNVFSMTDSNKQGELSSFYYYGMDDENSRENAVLMTKGRENLYDNILNLVSTLDLSSNNLSGEIPEGLVWLQKLQHLNLSRNNLRGSIPRQIGNMTALESLDLSRNQLSGEIPPSMSILTFLDYLDLSYNNLSGEIPKSTQLQSLNSSSFVGNRLLCGDPLPKGCREDDHASPLAKSRNGTKDDDDDDDDDEEEYWFKLGLVMGFGVGFLGIIAPLVLCGLWRRAYNWFIQEYIWYKISDCFIKIQAR